MTLIISILVVSNLLLSLCDLYQDQVGIRFLGKKMLHVFFQKPG